VLTLVTLISVLPEPARAATGTICDQYGTTTQGSYVVMNNRWGTSATQCINVTNNGFQITRQDGTGNTSGAPVSYPAIYVGCHYGNCSPGTNLPMRISSISTANTSTTVSYPSSGTYDAAYDIWLNADTNVSGVQDTEIMIWLNRVGSIQPIGSNTGNVTLGGRNWAVWVGNNGQNNVVSYQSTGITSFSADIKPFILDAITRGSGFGNTSWYLTSMQMGFEPWIGGVGLAVNSFSATISGGGGSNPTATRTRTPTRTPTRSTVPTNTPAPGVTPTRTPTRSTVPTNTPSSGGGTTCSPVNATITAPFTFDGAGNFCWRINNIPSFINSWNLTKLTVNGANWTNLWASPSQLPAKASDGYWYISYSSSVAWGHFEAK
jgi:hypothetical protein